MGLHGQESTGVEQNSKYDVEQYNVPAIRKLIKAAFTAKELRRFCQDHAPFRPILDDLSPSASLNDMADIVIEYCRKRRLFTELLDWVDAHNPQQYERFSPELVKKTKDSYQTPTPATSQQSETTPVAGEQTQDTATQSTRIEGSGNVVAGGNVTLGNQNVLGRENVVDPHPSLPDEKS